MEVQKNGINVELYDSFEMVGNRLARGKRINPDRMVDNTIEFPVKPHLLHYARFRGKTHNGRYAVLRLYPPSENAELVEHLRESTPNTGQLIAEVPFSVTAERKSLVLEVCGYDGKECIQVHFNLSSN